jgi:uncharacterized protein
MSLSMYQASVPVFVRGLQNLIVILEKGAAHCAERKIDPGVLTQFRLYPDMFNFAKQVQVACDHARNGAARLAGMEAPRLENTEQTFAELVGRVRDTLAYLDTFKPEQIDGSEAREVVVKRGETVNTYLGQDYLLQRALPNFFFHLTTAYDILRHNGVVLGKKDYIG